MKNYKVGDTVYLKAFVANVDKSDPEKTYGVNFVRGNYVIQAWPDCEAIIDELPVAEQVKPVLPKDVANEMDLYKAASCALSTYLKGAALNATEAKATHQYLYSYLSDNLLRDTRVKTLVNAWCSGYTVEHDYQILTGTELMKTAIDDWNAFPDNDETLFEWYPNLAKVLPNKKYKVNPQLEFEEVDE